MKKLVCNYEGIAIRVVLGLLHCKLYVNDILMDQYTAVVAPISKTLILRVIDYPFPSGKKTIEVYNKAIMFNKIMVCVDGNYVGGDRF
jgi:hypothetical protein